MAYEKIGTMADGSKFDFTTGSVVQPAPTPTIPQSNPLPQPDTPAVSRYPLGGDYKTAADKYFGSLDYSQPDEQAIKNSVRKEMQGQIDAVNKVYDQMSIEEARAGMGREGQTRALGARAGILGQDFGMAQMDNTKDYNKRAAQAVEDERALKVSGVLNQISQRSADMIAAKKQEALGNASNYLNYLKESQGQAREDLKTLAGSGVNLEQLTPEEQQGLMEQSGYNPVIFEAVYNASKPKAMQIDYKYIETKDGTMVRTGSDGSYKEMGNYRLPEGFKLTVTDDGTPIIMNPETGEVKLAEGFEQGQFGQDKRNQQNFENSLALEKLKLDRSQFSSDQSWKEAQMALDSAKYDLSVQEFEWNKTKPGADQKIVKIDGKDYVQNDDGSFTAPDVPEQTKQASDLQQQAGQSAQSLLDKFNSGKGTSAVGKSRLFQWQRVPGTDAKDFEIQFNNLKSLLSLDNIKLLKGQGQVSDAERKLLSDASAKLDLGQSEAEFKSALQDITVGLGVPGTLQAKDDGSYIYKNMDGSIRKGRQGDNYVDRTKPPAPSFSAVGGDTDLASISNIPDGEKAGQCGRFVNQITGLGVGDSYASKMSKMDKSIKKPQPGMVFTMPYKDTGHIGFIVGIDGKNAIVKDSNYSLDEKVKTHKIPISKMTGFAWA